MTSRRLTTTGLALALIATLTLVVGRPAPVTEAAVASGTTTELQITGRAGVPTGAIAVAINLTAVRAQQHGFVTAYPCGTPRPTASTLNYAAGDTIANSTIVTIGTTGKICLYNQGTTHLLADITGWFPTNSDYTPTGPQRLLDTRPASIVVSGTTTELQIIGRAGVPTGATAVAINLTAVRAQQHGFVTAYPCGTQRPTASTLNYAAGDTIANSTIVTIGTTGKICLYNQGTTHLLADITGWFPTNSDYTPTGPQRLLDTRPTTPPPATGGGGTTPEPGNRFVTVPVGGTLPTDAQCAGRVRPMTENRPGNTTYNSTGGTKSDATYPRVTGNFTGTTDEVIQWAACKWGIAEDIARAQIVAESYWNQTTLGDFTTDPNACAPGFPIGAYPPQYNGDRTHTNECPESIGLGQVRWLYHQSAFADRNAVTSSAYNLDYTYAVWRACFEGRFGWLNQVEGRGDYKAGDAQGCLGVWFSGRWYTTAATTYITKVDDHLTSRTWEQAWFGPARSR